MNNDRGGSRGGCIGGVRVRRSLWGLLPLFFLTLLLGGCGGMLDSDSRLAWNGSYGLLAVSRSNAFHQPELVRLTRFRLQDPNQERESEATKEIRTARDEAQTGSVIRVPEARRRAFEGMHVEAQDLGEYRGVLAGVMPDGADFLLVFSDGTIMRQHEQSLLPVLDGRNGLRLLNAAADSGTLYALQLTADGTLQVFRYQGSLDARKTQVPPARSRTPLGRDVVEPQERDEPAPKIRPGTIVAYAGAGVGTTGEGETLTAVSTAAATGKSGAEAAGWEPYGPVLPTPVSVAGAEMALLNGAPVIAIRSARSGMVEAGIKLACLREGTRPGLVWQWLPTPPGQAMSGVFSLCSYLDGLLLLQEPGRASEPQQNYLAYYTQAAGWASFASISQIGYGEGATTTSLTLAAGGPRAFALRVADGELQAFTTAQPAEPGWQRLLAPGTQAQARQSWPVWVLPVVVFALTLILMKVMRKRMLAEMERRQKQAAEQGVEAGPALEINTWMAASPVDRAVALLADMALVSPLPILYVGSAGRFSQEFMQGQGLAAYLLLLATLVVYSTAAEALFGQTFGKWLMRLQVRTVGGGRPTFLQVLSRNLLRGVDFFPVIIGDTMIWYLVALIAVTLTRRRQRVGDYFTGTLVRRVVPVAERRVILASASPRRRMLLEELGVKFTVQAADVDETPVKGVAARDMAERLARRKAERVAADAPADAVVIAADTVVVRDGEVLGKPADAEDAKAMLRSLSGRTHQVITAVSLIDKATGQFMDGSDLTEVEMRQITPEEIEAYVASGEPADKAGAYAIQGKGGQFVITARGSVSNVIGLPVEMLREMLQDLS